MRKNIIMSSLGVLLLVTFLFTAITYADSRFYNFSKPGNVKEEKIKTEIDDSLSKFENEVDTDVAKAHNISLKDYDKIDFNKLFDKNNKEYSSLRNIVMNIIHSQANGDIKPSLYLSKDKKEAYMLEKKNDGTNCLYTLKDSNGWKVVDTNKKPGKYFTSELDSNK